MSDAHTQLSLRAGDPLRDRYTLVRILGQGAMGQVWLATDSEMDGDQVALKVLKPELASDPRFLRQLKEEAKSNQRLSHPNIVRMQTLDKDEKRGGTYFLVMEYVEGRSGADLIEEHPQGLPHDQVFTMIRRIARAVDFAHSQDVLHKDIKPANVIRCTQDGNMKLLDFGIATAAQDSLARNTGQLTGDTSGTLAYMSPQQLRGEAGRSNDIYSLAATAYEFLCGQVPFRGGDLAVQIKEVLPEALPGVPAHVNQALMAGLAKDSAGRPKTARAFAEMLEGRSYTRASSAGRRAGSASSADAVRTTVARKPGRWYRDGSSQAEHGPLSPEDWSDMVKAGGVRAGDSFLDMESGRSEPPWIGIEPDDVWWWNGDRDRVLGPIPPSEWQAWIDAGQVVSGFWRRSTDFLESGRALWFEVALDGEVREDGGAIPLEDPPEASGGSSTQSSRVLDADHWWYGAPDGTNHGPYTDEEFSDHVVAGHIHPGGYMRRSRYVAPDEGETWTRIDPEDIWYWPENGLARGIWTPDQWDRILAEGRVQGGWYRRSDTFLEDGRAGWFDVPSSSYVAAESTTPAAAESSSPGEAGPAIPIGRQDLFRWLTIGGLGIVFLWMIWPSSDAWLSWPMRLFWGSALLGVGSGLTFFLTEDYKVDTPAEVALKWMGIGGGGLAALAVVIKLGVMAANGKPDGWALANCPLNVPGSCCRTVCENDPECCVDGGWDNGCYLAVQDCAGL